MNIAAKSLEQVKIWNAYRQVCSLNETERMVGRETLKRLAPASLPCLRFCIEMQNVKRTQFIAAVALYQLGEPLGLKTLTENLRLHLPHRPDIATDLEAAWVTLGEPDATTELLALWDKITDWSDANPVLVSIGHIWAKMRDPRVLEALSGKAARIPKIFDETLAPFGESALPVLEKMTRDPDSYVRYLAIQALKKLVGVRSLNLLVPLLRDPDAVVRAQVPQAMLKMGWPAESVRQISLAIEAGFSSPEAVGVMETTGPVNYDALLTLVNRWNPASRKVGGDTEPAVFAALRVFEKTPVADAALLPALRDLLRRSVSSALTAETIRLLGVVGLRDTAAVAPLRDELLPFLAFADDTVRGSAARTLDLLGDALGAELEQKIAETRPKDSLLTKFQSLLSGGMDAETATDEALQQVGDWLTRVGKETSARLRLNSKGVIAPAPEDARLPELLKNLLNNALLALDRAQAADEIATRLSLCAACLRVASRFLSSEQAIVLHDAIVRALHCVKFGEVSGKVTGSAMRAGDVREVGRLIRREAGATLWKMYRNDSFPLFVEALYDSTPDIRLTAIAALGRIGDARALLHLTPYLKKADSPFYVAAKEADALIRGANPEIMTLLRASSGQSDARPETLLRPASGGGNATPPDQLLRPASPE